MVERDKNHPSVVIWSLGNEATYQAYNMDENYCFYNSTQWILQRDPSRIRKYERDNRYTKGDRTKSMVDIYSSQYWGVDSVKSQVTNTGNKLPYIQSEYAHAMGNALGNFKEYWDIFRNYPNAQGGFIWDWIDQSVSTKVENTTTYTITDSNTGVATKFDGKVTEGRNNTKAIQGTYAATDSAKLATNSTTGITLDVWVKPSENFTKSAQAFISRGDSDGYNLQIDRYGKFEFFVDGWSGGTLSADIPSDFTDGNWHRLTATYIGTEYKLYYDGKQLATGQRTNKTTCDASSNPIDITIGASADQSGRTFNGAIDRAAVIKGVMTEEQIQNTNDNLDAVKDNVAYSIDFGSASIKSEGTNYKDSTYFAYGGDWGETVNDNDFCANGILNADRTPSAELYEVKKVHQEVSFYDDGEAANGKVRVVNEFLNTNLNKYNVSWTLKEDNKVIGSGQLSEEQKNIAPQAEATVTLANFPKVSATAGSDYTLTLSVTLKEDAAWAGDYYGHEGDEVAFEEFDLAYTPEKAQPTISASDMDKVNVAESDDAITVTGKTSKTNGKAFEVVIDKAQGYITSYKVDGKSLLENGPVPNYYRAPVSNDPSFSTAMKNAAQNFTLDENGITVDKKDKVVNIHVSGSIPEVNTPNSIDYMIYGNGEIVVTNTVTPSASAGNIARIGMKMTVAKDYEKLTYYGNGPQANYVDRNTGAKLGIYNSTVTEQFEKKYVKPQENGNHTGVRWTALTAEDGTGILVSSDSEMESGALHYKAEDLASYRHPYQVPVQENTILTVDLMQRGLGNASCGPAPLSKYIISAGKTYTQTFSILPLTKQTSDEEKMAKSNEDVKSGMPLTGIKVNGKELDNFSDGQNEYTYTLLRGSYEEGKVPQVEAIEKSDDVIVTVTQATAVPGTATIKAVSPFGVEKTYTINFKVQDELYVSDMDWTVDQGGYFENTRDACGCGNPMAVYVEGTKQSFDKGVAMHAPAELGVNLEGKGVSRFTARIGISADQMRNEAGDQFIYGNPKRFHDGYFSLLAQIEAGITGKRWADELFVSASYSKTDKELQTGSVQTKVYGMAERNSDAWNLSARYSKYNFITEGMTLKATLSHTWDHSITIDTAYRKYYWDGGYIVSQRNEIRGNEPSIRHYKRPLTIARANLDYRLNGHHGFNLNYHMSRTGNDRYDDLDQSFEPSNDAVTKHIIGLTYSQSFLDGKMQNVFFAKDYVNHPDIRQTDQSAVTGSDKVQGSATQNYLGYGVGLRYIFFDPLAVKVSFEHSVRLPIARELLGNGTTVYANVALEPEKSNNVNLALFGTWHPAGRHTVYYEANGFLRYVDNYIQTSVIEKEGMMQYVNDPAVHIKGVEGEVRYDWDGRLQFMANVSYQDARDQQKYKEDGKPSATYDNHVPNRPWLFGSAEASYTFRNLLQQDNKLRLGCTFQWVHWYFLTWEAYGNYDTKARIPSQHICNANVTYSWKRDRYNIALECSNFLDETAYDNYKLQKPGRAFFAKFRVFIY